MRPPSIAVSATARDFLRKLHPSTRKSIRRALDKLRHAPYSGKPLKEELAGLWSLPVSRHRIICQVEKDRITIAHIGRRRDVYERLRELLTK